MKIIRTFLIVIGLIHFSIKINAQNGHDIIIDIIDSISNDELFIETYGKYDIEVSPETISFYCYKVQEDYIRKEIDADFSSLKLDKVLQYLNVIDSIGIYLDSLSDTLNNSVCNEYVKGFNKVVEDEGVILYSTKVCDYIYVEIKYYNSKNYMSKSYLDIGQCKLLCYLFKIENEKIVKYYNGLMYLD